MTAPDIVGLCLSAGAAALAVGLVRSQRAWSSSRAIFASMLASLSFLFPLRIAPAVLAGGLLLNAAITSANRYKIRLTGMPITFIDLKFFVLKPWVLPKLLPLRRSLIWSLYALASLLDLVMASFVAYSVRTGVTPAASGRAVLGVFAIAACVPIGKRFVADIHRHLEQSDTTPWGEDATATWMPEFQSRLSMHLGCIPFLVYSYSHYRTFVPALLEEGLGRKSEASTVTPPVPHIRAGRDRPNVVVLQLESVFNPNWAFSLKRDFTNSLFQANAWSTALLPLRVNTVGGGSWVAEFEFLTGLDVRLFGHDGYYTHAWLPNFIGEAFPKFVSNRGYRTVALYSADGDFYDAGSAYRRYGFDTLLDPARLGIPSWDSSDSQMAAALIEQIGRMDSVSPLFAYAVTNGAHSPFRNIEAPVAGAAFAGEADQAVADTLTRYCRLAADSAAAVESILSHLVAREKETGRPFVLLVYGDHQPWTFAPDTYDQFRTEPRKNVTFVHVMDSERRSPCVSGELPVTLLPSLLSRLMFANEDAYLPINFFLHERMGPNVFPNLGRKRKMINLDEIFNDRSTAPEAAHQSPELSSAELQAIQWIAQSSVIRRQYGRSGIGRGGNRVAAGVSRPRAIVPNELFPTLTSRQFPASQKSP